MSTFIISGNYTNDGIKGMMAKPSDRQAAVKPLVDAVGGRLVSYYVTTGRHDFQLIVEGANPQDLMASLIVAGAGGGVCNLQTVQAFSTDEFKAAQVKAGKMASVFKSPGS